jgi:hypothetical protein
VLGSRNYPGSRSPIYILLIWVSLRLFLETVRKLPVSVVLGLSKKDLFRLRKSVRFDLMSPFFISRRRPVEIGVLIWDAKGLAKEIGVFENGRFMLEFEVGDRT